MLMVRKKIHVECKNQNAKNETNKRFKHIDLNRCRKLVVITYHSEDVHGCPSDL